MTCVDVHHLFPKRWCTQKEIDSRIADSVVNKTAIDARINRIIGGDAPSQYLERLEERYVKDPIELDAILQSHDVDSPALRRNDFKSFFNQRFERLVAQIEDSMGKPANRSAVLDESSLVA